MRSAAMFAWRSENVRTRSGLSAMILSMFAEGEGTHPWLLAASLRRADDIAGDAADDAFLLAGQIQRLKITCPAATEKKPTPFAGCRPQQLGWLFRFSSRPCRRH